MKNASVIHLVASPAVKKELAALAKPVVSVSARGRMVQQNGQNLLVLQCISTQTSRSLPIITNNVAKAKLANLVKSSDATTVVLNGTVVQNTNGNVLVLNNVVAAQSLAIVADADTKCALAGLSQNGQETNLTAKVVAKNGRKTLVLSAAEGSKKKK